MTIQGLLDKVKTVDLRSAVPDIIVRTKADAILLNQLQMFQFGLKADGNKIGEYKNKYYAQYKNRKNPQPGFGYVDLSDKKDFYNGFTLDVTKTTFEFDSKDSKSDKLKKQYGNTIFGLTKDSKKTYSLDTILPAVQKYITGKTGLKFT